MKGSGGRSLIDGHSGPSVPHEFYGSQSLGRQIVATLIAIYGIFMTPLGWNWALFVWGYAILLFLLNDRLKLAAYRVFNPATLPVPAKV